MQTFVLHGPSRSRAEAVWRLAVMQDYVEAVGGLVMVARIEGESSRSLNAHVIFDRWGVPTLSWSEYLEQREQDVRSRTRTLPGQPKEKE